jgi:hypothetical protein
VACDEAGLHGGGGGAGAWKYLRMEEVGRKEEIRSGARQAGGLGRGGRFLILGGVWRGLEEGSGLVNEGLTE